MHLWGVETTMTQRKLGGLYLALAASIWGGMYVVSKVVLEVIPPLELVWLRYIVAIASLLVMGVVTRQSWKIRLRDIPIVALISMIGYVVSVYTQFLGTKLSTAQMGSVITSATPAFMVVFARIILGERVTWRKAISVCLATVGVILIVGIGDFHSSARLGGLVLFAAALTWALMSVLVKKIPNHYSQIVVTTYAILFAAIVMAPFGLTQVHHAFNAMTRPATLAGVLYLGIISTAGAFFLWNKGLQMVDASSAGLYFFFQPMVGTLLGWLILGEQVGISFWFGTILILSGVMLVIRE